MEALRAPLPCEGGARCFYAELGIASGWPLVSTLRGRQHGSARRDCLCKHHAMGGDEKLVDVGGIRLGDDHHEFGPYAVERECQRFSTGWPLRPRDVRPTGRCTFTVATDDGRSSCTIGAGLNSDPVHIRRGVDVTCEAGPVRVEKSWFRPVFIRGGAINWTVTRRGIGGWRISDESGRQLADYRWLRLRIRDNLTPSEAALVVGLHETGVTNAVSLLAWFKGI